MQVNLALDGNAGRHGTDKRRQDVKTHDESTAHCFPSFVFQSFVVSFDPLLFQSLVFSYSAVTTVLIPPRTEKSPTTVMRRGRMAATRSSRIWLVTDS